MNRREAIHDVLAGGRSVRLPRALYGAGRWAYRQGDLRIRDLAGDPRGFGEALAGVFEGLDTDIVFAGSGLNSFPAEAIGGSLAFKEEQAPLLAFPVIEKADDARYFRSIDLQGSPHTLALVEMIAELRARLPDRFLCATSWGPFTWGMILCDWNRLKDETATDTGFVRDVCELGYRLTRAFCSLLADRGLIDGIAVPDGATTLIPTDLYREVVLPCQRDLFDWARGRGLRSFLHQCGNIGPQLALYPETGADCITVDASVSLGDAYDLYRGRTVTAGNVDAINTILGGDPAAISREVANCLRSVSDPRQGFILMPSCDLPPDTPRRNAEAFLGAADSA